MKYERLKGLFAVIIITCSACQTTEYGGRGEVNFLYGNRDLDDKSFWEPLDGQDSGGVAIVHNGVEAGFQISSDDYAYADGLITASTDIEELSVGYRWTHDAYGWRVYVGPGISLMNVSARLDVPVLGFSLSEGDDTFGIYLHAGLAVEVGKWGLIGVDVRKVSGTDIQFPTLGDTDIDYEQISLFIGGAW